jgi:hypothetical protein
MKYVFTFSEVNYGSVEIESEYTPTRAEVIDAIENGNAHINDTDYEKIRLEETERLTQKKERGHER